MAKIGKRVRKDRTNEIIKEATRLFGIHGFRGTTLAKVADAVDLTEAGLLHYFPSKVHLLQGVLAFREEQDKVRMGEFLDIDQPRLEAVVSALNDVVARNETNPVIIRLFTVLVSESIRKDHPSHEYFVNRYEEVRTEFNLLLKQLAEEDEIRKDLDYESISILLIAVMDGLQIQWLQNPDKISMRKTFEIFLEIFTSYLQKEHLI